MIMSNCIKPMDEVPFRFIKWKLSHFISSFSRSFYIFFAEVWECIYSLKVLKFESVYLIPLFLVIRFLFFLEIDQVNWIFSARPPVGVHWDAHIALAFSDWGENLIAELLLTEFFGKDHAFLVLIYNVFWSSCVELAAIRTRFFANCGTTIRQQTFINSWWFMSILLELNRFTDNIIMERSTFIEAIRGCWHVMESHMVNARFHFVVYRRHKVFACTSARIWKVG